MNSTNIKIYIPILAPFPIEGKLFTDWHQKAKKEIINLSHSDVFRLDPRLTADEPMRIDVLVSEVEDTTKLSPQAQRMLQANNARERTLLCFLLICDLPQLGGKDVANFSPEQLSYLQKDFVAGELMKNISDIMTLAHIAKPGCIQAGRGVIEIDEQVFKETRGFFTSAIPAVEVANRVGWPPIQEIEIVEVLEWALKTPGVSMGMAQTKLGRALGALSYLVVPSFSEEQLSIMWAMLGLEALYCSGTSDLNKQLREKTEIYLGIRTEHKKKFDNVYNFRSRFVHGDANFPFSYCFWDGEPVYESFMEESGDAEWFAYATLLSTLQKMCKEKRYELKFEYVLSNEQNLTLI